MSFLSVFKNIGRVFAIAAPVAESVLSIVDPPLAALFAPVVNSIVRIEASIPQDGAGPAKAPLVLQDFETNVLSFMRDILAGQGKQITYDVGKLQTAINSQVAAFNAFADLKKSFVISDLPKV